ncbi:ABC transporter ATP-binding protein [Salipaludibacillus agaradhaerens]|uniref:ABC transporter ATP-binding protein n=1 Tax=Salipaludibacillus agaradhaerens TaxID=76935 RepID=UPI001473CF22|nr:ABC transporter ATP-binding protein [Salipaludibacillus agaradhaerens]
MTRLQASNVTFAYNKEPIIENLNMTIPEGEITVLIGSNGCGKSTLLKMLARLLFPSKGGVYLNDNEMLSLPAKAVAKELAVLPQSAVSPEGLTVRQLVKQGRYPYQSWLKQWSKEDEEMVEYALAATGLTDLRDRPLNALSGGQRQRTWIAMTLTQGTKTLLLDEPTTYLDLTHQVDVLDLLFELNEKEQRTIVMVLHDINLACRYAHNIVAVKDKRIYAQGRPEEIITVNTLKEVFQMDCEIIYDPIFGSPLCVPHGRGRAVSNHMSPKTPHI